MTNKTAAKIISVRFHYRLVAIKSQTALLDTLSEYRTDNISLNDLIMRAGGLKGT